MSLDIEDLKDQINDTIEGWAAQQGIVTLPVESEPADEPRVLPEGKRVVRTKSSADRVYLLDEEKKTRQWITNPEVLDASGFTMEDVQTVEDGELLKYNMGPALYRVEDAA